MIGLVGIRFVVEGVGKARERTGKDGLKTKTRLAKSLKKEAETQSVSYGSCRETSRKNSLVH